MMPTSTKGILGHFYEPADALAAAAKVRDAGWKHFDFLTPFPIHGMEDAMGQKKSWIPYVTAVLALVRHPLRPGPPELRDGLGLADELRRQAVRGVAGVHPDHLRGDGLLGGARQRGRRDRRREDGHDSAAAADAREDRRDRSTGSCSGSPRQTRSGMPPRPSVSCGRSAPTGCGSSTCKEAPMRNIARALAPVALIVWLAGCDVGLPAGTDAPPRGEPPRHDRPAEAEAAAEGPLRRPAHRPHGAPGRDRGCRRDSVSVRAERGRPGGRRAGQPAPADARRARSRPVRLRARLHRLPRAEGRRRRSRHGALPEAARA